MNLRPALLWRYCLLPVLQVILLTIVQVVGFAIGSQLAGFSSIQKQSKSTETSTSEIEQESTDSDLGGEQNSEHSNPTQTRQAQQIHVFGMLMLACFLNAIAVLFWLKQTTLSGLPLVVGVAAASFACMTLMPQSETWFFLRNSGSIIRSAAAMGLVVSGLIGFSSIFLLWRWKPLESRSPAFVLLSSSLKGTVLRILFSVICYVILYLLFGYFIAWQNPELRALYGGGEQLLGFWERITTPPTSNRVIPLQIVRGLVWTLICLAMMRVSNGSRLRVALSIGLFLATVMNSQLLLPNPVMSENVRHVHLLETATSNFLFGVVCVWIWTFPKRHEGS